MPIANFNSLVLNHAGDLHRVAYRFTQDRESANDLSQETIYLALANREKYSTGTNFKAWLFTIMHNTFINDYRRKVKLKTIFSSISNEILIASDRAVIKEESESMLRLKEIQQVIYRLPQNFRIPFLLYFEGYRYQEIAHSLNEPLGTIKSRIHFARKLLKEKIILN